MTRLRFCHVLILGAGLLSVPCFSQVQKRFRSDDPIRVDPDNLPISEPEPRELSQIFDFLKNTFSHRPETRTILPVENVNTLGEVPDSSWFQLRMGRKRMTIENWLEVPTRERVQTGRNHGSLLP